MDKKIVVLAILVSFCLNFSLFEKTKWVWHKGEYSYVRVAKPDKGLERLDHPADISPEQVQKILAGIKYQRAWINLGELVKAKDYDLFTMEEAGIIAPYLSQGLKESNSSQWVDFSLEVHRGQFLVFGEDQVTDGVAFVREGKLNLAFRNISQKLGQESTPNIVSPLKAYPGSAHLVPGPGQELRKNQKGKQETNWLVIDLKSLSQPAEAAKPEVKEEKKPEPEKVAEPAPAVITQPAAVEKPQGSTEPSHPKSLKSVKERLTELREIFDQGLISEDEYNKKREDILKEL